MTDVMKNAESPLSLDIFGLRSEVGYFLGKGRDWQALSDMDRQTIDAHIGTGLRMFYSAHTWSFLRPWQTINLIDGEWRYDLPADFGYCNGNLDVRREGGAKGRMQLIGQTQMMGLDHERKGMPRYYAISPKEMPPDQGQRFELLLWPTPQNDLFVNLQYSVVPWTITTTGNTFPYGGMFHSETIREACLAAAESDTDDQIGVHRQLYLQLLEQSKRIDAEQSVADNLGYNGDGAKGVRGRRDLRMFLNDYEINKPEPPPEDNSIYWRP